MKRDIHFLRKCSSPLNFYHSRGFLQNRYFSTCHVIRQRHEEGLRPIEHLATVMMTDSSMLSDRKYLVETPAANIHPDDGEEQCDAVPTKRDTNGIPRWFRTMFYIQKSEVVSCFNRTECALRLRSPGTGNSEAFHSEYESRLVKCDLRRAYIQKRMREVVSRRIRVYDDSDRTDKQYSRNVLSSAGMCPTTNDVRAVYCIGACGEEYINEAKFCATSGLTRWFLSRHHTGNVLRTERR